MQLKVAPKARCVQNFRAGLVEFPSIKVALLYFQVDKSELSKLFLHKIPKGTPREELTRAFPSLMEPHVQMVTWGPSGTGTTFAVFKNPEVANNAFKALVGKEHKVSMVWRLVQIFRCVSVGRTVSTVYRENGGGTLCCVGSWYVQEIVLGHLS